MAEEKNLIFFFNKIQFIFLLRYNWYNCINQQNVQLVQFTRYVASFVTKKSTHAESSLNPQSVKLMLYIILFTNKEAWFDSLLFLLNCNTSSSVIRFHSSF